MDIIFQKFIEPERWEYALSKGVDKDMNYKDLRGLSNPLVRLELFRKIENGTYNFFPPHTALIPKDKPGEFRTVYIGENVDRLCESIGNDLLFELTPDRIHQSCKSYQKGIGCGKVVQELTKRIMASDDNLIGWKADLTKYFDKVPLRYIMGAFDMVEERYGHSCLIDLFRRYYECDIYFDIDGVPQHKYQSLKQGCAIAAWLADVILYHIDERLSSLDGYYARYCDDLIFIGNDKDKAMEILKEELSEMELDLNMKKVDNLYKDKWFKFLGYSIKGNQISLSSSRIKKFQKSIEDSVKGKKDMKSAIRSIYRTLYYGNGEYSWATQILPVVNSEKDILELDKYVMDSIRSVATNKSKIGGLGYVCTKTDGCISRGIGRNVRANRNKIPHIEDYHTIRCMQNAMNTDRAAYETIVRMM